MNKDLELLLAEHLGELIYQRDNTYNWIEKDRILRKINAINELLEIGEKQPTYLDAIKQTVKGGIKNV
jgi:hypothetical protein